MLPYSDTVLIRIYSCGTTWPPLQAWIVFVARIDGRGGGEIRGWINFSRMRADRHKFSVSDVTNGASDGW